MIIFSQVRATCVQIAYHSKLEVSSLSGDFKNAHRSPAEVKQVEPNKFEEIPLTPRVTHAHTPSLSLSVQFFAILRLQKAG